MKQILFAFLLATGFLTLGRADNTSAVPPTTYTGHVDGTKDLSNGALVVNLDGTYPNQKMSLFISAENKAKFGRLPAVGDTVTATGLLSDFNGHQEIKLKDPADLVWVDVPAATPAPATTTSSSSTTTTTTTTPAPASP